MEYKEIEQEPEMVTREEDIEEDMSEDQRNNNNMAASIMEHTDPRGLLLEMEHQLKGEEWNPLERKFEQKRSPYMNEFGITRIMTNMRRIVNSNCILSNISKQQVKKTMKSFRVNMIFLLGMEYEELGAKKSDLETIAWLCCDMAHFALLRGMNEGERNFLKKSISERISFSPNQHKEKEATFGKRWF